MKHFLTSVPLIYGKGLNIWLGLVLLAQISFQVPSGIAVFRGNKKIFPYHRLNGFIIGFVVFIHAYYGIGIWFFGFKYGL